MPHHCSCRLEANVAPAALVDIGTFGGNAPDGVLGGQYRRHRRHLDTQVRNECN
jgi:hypothetical protein